MIKPKSFTASFVAQQKPCVDVERFRADLREADIEDMVDTLLATFLEDSPNRLSALENAVQLQDATAIQSAAHAFKSGAGTIRATHLAELLRDAEEAARTGQAFSSEPLEEIRVEYAAVRRQLEAAIGNGS